VLSVAQRVRVLHVDYSDSASSGLSKFALLDILRSIDLYRPTLPLFPQLRRLSWSPWNHTDALPYICLFLQHSLTFLSLDWTTFNTDCSHQLVNVFHRIRHQCSDLRDLRISGTFEAVEGSVTEAIGLLLSSLDYLRVFHLVGVTLTADGCGHLAGSSSLRQLYLTWPSTERSQRSAMAKIRECDRPFPDLEHVTLCLEASDADPGVRRNSTVPALLGVVTGPLVGFDLHSHALSRQVFETLGKQLIPMRNTLRRLFLEYGTDTAEQADDTVAEFQVDMHVLQPLCELPHLEHFKLSTPHLAIDSAGLRRLVSAWPLLESFHLAPLCVRRVPGPLVEQGLRPACQLDDLWHIAAGCPRLNRLSLPMHITWEDIRSRRLVMRPQRCLESLWLVNSVVPEGHAALLASYLSAIFPALHHVGVIYPDLVGPGVTTADIEAYEHAQTAQRAVFRDVSRFTAQVAAARAKGYRF
jgi:hypothetical protein